MIIVCPECSTKFNIAAERIPDKGTKVRCARCRHVFTVEPEADAPPTVEPAAEVTPPADPADINQLDEFGRFEQKDEDDASVATDFSYDRFQELDGKGAEQEDHLAAGADMDRPAAEDSESAETTEPVAEELGPIEKIFNDNDRAAENGADEIPEEADDIFAATSEEPAQSEPSPLSPPVKPKRGPAASIIRILLFLIVGLLIVAGIMIYMNGTDQFNRTLEQLFGQQNVEQPAPGRITLAGLEGRFINNEQSGELFVIEGQAINNYKEPRAAIQVKGIIYDQTGQALLQKTIFCGNPISEEDLKTLPFAELETFMGNQFGKNLSNMKVAPEQRIPFVIVFKDLPANLAEFSVKVTASKPATN
jgi:predicted Zn finger-like uncharacterized protein